MNELLKTWFKTGTSCRLYLLKQRYFLDLKQKKKKKFIYLFIFITFILAEFVV